MMEWISVKNELPGIEDDYLITFTARYGRTTRTRPLIAICEWSEHKGISDWRTDTFDYADIEVTAWMPLPTPYYEPQESEDKWKIY